MDIADEPLPFWGVLLGFDEGKPVRRASAEDLERTEAHVGYRLPTGLKKLLMIQDGGVSNYGVFLDGDRSFPVLAFLGACNGAGSIVYAFDVRDDFPPLPDGLLVFATGAHSLMALDYRADPNEPSVVYQDTEDDPLELVAPSFDAFLAGLHEDYPE